MVWKLTHSGLENSMPVLTTPRFDLIADCVVKFDNFLSLNWIFFLHKLWPLRLLSYNRIYFIPLIQQQLTSHSIYLQKNSTGCAHLLYYFVKAVTFIPFSFPVQPQNKQSFPQHRLLSLALSMFAWIPPRRRLMRLSQTAFPFNLCARWVKIRQVKTYLF